MSVLAAVGYVAIFLSFVILLAFFLRLMSEVLLKLGVG